MTVVINVLHFCFELTVEDEVQQNEAFDRFLIHGI